MSSYRLEYSERAEKKINETAGEVRDEIVVDLQRFANFASNKDSGKHTTHIIQGKSFKAEATIRHDEDRVYVLDIDIYLN